MTSYTWSRSVAESFRGAPVCGVVRLPLLRFASRWQALIIAERKTSGVLCVDPFIAPLKTS
jgi:hypothetical protein